MLTVLMVDTRDSINHQVFSLGSCVAGIFLRKRNLIRFPKQFVIEDKLISSRNCQEYLENLKRLLEEIKSRIWQKKINFLEDKVEYLEFLISKYEVEALVGKS